MNKNKQYDEKLDDELGKIRSLLISKHHDYGDENLLRHGLFGIIVRMSDKLARLENLHDKNEEMVEDEKISDTLQDLAGYAIQALVLSDKL